MISPDNYGLFFGEKELALAREQRAAAPLAAAWAQLARPPALAERSDALHSLALWGGMRYRLLDDAEAGARGATVLRELASDEAASGYERAAGQLLAQAQAWGLLWPLLDKDGLALRALWRERWQGLPAPEEYDDRAWSLLLRAVAAHLFQEGEGLAASALEFRERLARDLHPEGYWRPVVGEKMGQARPESFRRQLRTTQAFALLAELAQQGGEALWAAHSRQVSLRTAIAYCAYYHFYPEHWRWEAEPLHEAVAVAAFRQYGAFFELAARRAPTRPLPLLLRELRPLFNLYGGGWLTLTHAHSPPKTMSGWQTWLLRLRDRWRR